MRSRSLGPDDYDDLLKATAEEAITRPPRDAHKDDIETALVRYDGARCVFRQSAPIDAYHPQLRGFYEGNPRAGRSPAWPG
jgi:hypothetical protein